MKDMCAKFETRKIKIIHVQPNKMQPRELEDLRARDHRRFQVLSGDFGGPELYFTCVLAIDEAHLIVDWGDMFRSAYKSMGELRSHFDSAPLLLCTATCTQEVKDKICEVMFIDESEMKSVVLLPDRPNIYLTFHKDHPANLEDALDWYLQEMARDGIKTRKAVIYCRSIRHTGRGFGMLLYKAQEAAFKDKQPSFKSKMIGEYHAEVQDADKERLLQEFRKPDSTIRCLVSTVAFGLGIDIPDIRLIIHWGESENIAQFWQEIYHRQIQLLQCKPDIKTAITEISSGKCMRQCVLQNLKLKGMVSVDTKSTVYCSVCDAKPKVTDPPTEDTEGGQ